MMELKDNSVLITKDDGTSEEWKLYFYYEDPKRAKTFYFLYKEADPDSLIVMASSDGKELLNVSDEEYEEAEEMLSSYENDPKIGEIR